MKVLQVNTVYPNGSTGRIVAQIAGHTASQPDSQALVAFGIGEETHGESLSAYRIGSPVERKFHGLIRKLFDAEGYGSHRATRRLIRLCERENVDIIHLHNLHGCYLNLRGWFWYLQKSNLPVIWTFHDCWPMTGHCAHFAYCGCEQWKTLCKICPQKRNYPVCVGISGSKRNYRRKQQLFTGVDKMTIVVPCRWLEGIVRESFLRDIQTRLIYNGVDLQTFHPVQTDIKEKYGLVGKRLLLAVASDWTERKGISILKEFSELLDESYQLAVIGLTAEQRKAMPKSILSMGRTKTADELCAWYSAADCFVNPTLEDTMPLVNLEALACGTPVAVFNTGGCPEAITEACGIVVVQGDARGLQSAVKQICESDVDYTDACVAQARQFSLQNTLQRYDALYQEAFQ